MQEKLYALYQLSSAVTFCISFALQYVGRRGEAVTLFSVFLADKTVSVELVFCAFRVPVSTISQGASVFLSDIISGTRQAGEKVSQKCLYYTECLLQLFNMMVKALISLKRHLYLERTSEKLKYPSMKLETHSFLYNPSHAAISWSHY